MSLIGLIQALAGRRGLFAGGIQRNRSTILLQSFIAAVHQVRNLARREQGPLAQLFVFTVAVSGGLVSLDRFLILVLPAQSIRERELSHFYVGVRILALF